MSGLCIMSMSILLTIGAEAHGNSCKTDVTVELKNVTAFNNLTILDNEDRVSYSPEEYIKRKVENETKYWGCLCDVKTCVRKCCPLGKSLGDGKSCVQRQDSEDFMVNVTDTKTERTYFVNRSSHFTWIYGVPGTEKNSYFLDPDNYPEDIYYINAEDGKLTTPDFENKTFGIDDFCIDYLNQTREYRVILRDEQSDEDEIPSVLYPILMTISLPPLLATFIIYASIAELRNLHGYCLLSYVTCLFFFYIFLAMGHTGINWLSTGLCYFVGFSSVFWFLGVFFWLNVMGFDVCITFSNIRPITGTMREKERKKFMCYSLYCWGFPSVFLIAAIVSEFAPNNPHHLLKPNIATVRCWFANRRAELCFCYAPASVLMICNGIMFIVTLFNLIKLNKEFRVMKQAGARSNEDKRNKSMLYVKLVIMMGINWALELTSWAVQGNYWWYLSDIFNCLQGWFVFLIFVWTGKPKELAQEKFLRCVMRNESQGAVTTMRWKPDSEVKTSESDPQKLSTTSADLSSSSA